MSSIKFTNIPVYVAVSKTGTEIARGAIAEVQSIAKAYALEHGASVKVERLVAQADRKSVAVGKAMATKALNAVRSGDPGLLSAAVERMAQHPRYKHYDVVKKAARGEALTANQVSWLVKTDAQERSAKKLRAALVEEIPPWETA